jgi:D-alanine-D-alanine ligase
MTGQGHRVTEVDASQPLPHWVSALEGTDPDLVFNLAEGTTGPLRQSSYTEVMTQLGLPYTGSGPRAQAIALDKHLSKLLVRDQGIATPAAVLVTPNVKADLTRLDYPCIVKPNFEGTSRGISSGSVVRSPDGAAEAAGRALEEFPDGILVESFVAGTDVTVPFLEGAPGGAGVLEPSLVRVLDLSGRPTDRILDYPVKHAAHTRAATIEHLVEARTPAGLPEDVRAAARAMTALAVQAVGCRDVARVDFRLDSGGRLHFLEINALPGLDPDGSIHRAAELGGLRPATGVVTAIVTSASARFAL